VIREATKRDLPLLRELWREFDAEVPSPPHLDDAADDLVELDEDVANGIVLIAENDGEVEGFISGGMRGERYAFLSNLYVRPGARRGGTARTLVHEFVMRARARGAEAIELEVLTSNANARTIYGRWGFDEYMLTLVADASELEQRLGDRATGRTFGSVHVQTDDRAAVERAVAKYLPRLGRSAGTEVSEARNGWIAVYDELCDREPERLERLARELSYLSGAPTLAIGVEDGAVVHYTFYDRGGAVDEYRSVPEYHGPLPSGDVVALGANPTVVARLTGADPARVRAIARTASSPDELPSAEELLGELADAMGIEGAIRGWEG
jgi:GNAT superfamily N-acetyltransferase